jgi:hypothetical protein
MEGRSSRSCAIWNAVWSSNECREELRASASTNDQSHFSAVRCMQIARKGKQKSYIVK